MRFRHFDAGGLDAVRRRGVAGKAVLVGNADAKAGTGEHGRQGRPGAAGADDDHVEGVTHRCPPLGKSGDPTSVEIEPSPSRATLVRADTQVDYAEVISGTRGRRRKIVACTARAATVARPKAAAVASAGRATASVKQKAAKP